MVHGGFLQGSRYPPFRDGGGLTNQFYTLSDSPSLAVPKSQHDGGTFFEGRASIANDLLKRCKVKIKTQHFLILFGIILLAMMACLPIAVFGLAYQPAQEVPATQFAATVQAMVAQNAAATPIPPTQTPPAPTATSIPPTNAPPATSTPLSYCYWVEFVKDVTVPDGSVFAPGESFTKTWRLRNRGTCAWDTDTMLVLTSGAQMNGPVVVALPGYVGPGQTVDVSVFLTTPGTPGHYVGYWMLRSPSGALFGTGNKADTAFYVDIISKEGLPHGTVTGNFCYPSEYNPPLILYFEKAGTSELIQFSIAEKQPNFSVLLPNGIYYAYAWAPNYNLEGAYVNPDRTMRTLVVRGGETTSGIGICDWDAAHHSRGQ
jgi:hypothetical protein